MRAPTPRIIGPGLGRQRSRSRAAGLQADPRPPLSKRTREPCRGHAERPLWTTNERAEQPRAEVLLRPGGAVVRGVRSGAAGARAKRVVHAVSRPGDALTRCGFTGASRSGCCVPSSRDLSGVSRLTRR
jgi:hypothetical protein